jgi:hypothetical protein
MIRVAMLLVLVTASRKAHTTAMSYTLITFDH